MWTSFRVVVVETSRPPPERTGSSLPVRLVYLPPSRPGSSWLFASGHFTQTSLLITCSAEEQSQSCFLDSLLTPSWSVHVYSDISQRRVRRWDLWEPLVCAQTTLQLNLGSEQNLSRTANTMHQAWTAFNIWLIRHCTNVTVHIDSLCVNWGFSQYPCFKTLKNN